jgi:uncharacterized protein (TIGR03086 family)
MDLDEIRSRYTRLADAFAAKIDAVPGDKWGAPTPCEGWSARDLVNHVTESPGMVFKMGNREFAAPAPSDDPAAAFASTRRQIEQLLADPDAAGAEYDGFFGRTTLAESIDRFISFDLVLHGWDLARATGQDETIPPEEIRRLTEEAKAWGDTARSPGVFGPEVETPAGADAQAKLIAFTGRTP